LHYFNSTDLGKIHQLLPDDQLASLFPTKKPQGAKPWLSNAGKIRLILLKHYSGLSDEKLVERLNTDWAYQAFCHLTLLPGELIKDRSLVTRVRKEVSALGWSCLQNLFQNHWKPLLSPQELKTLLMDATCYESWIRYPTDIKLIWESCQWIHQGILGLCSTLSQRRPRNKFLYQQKKYMAYARRRKKTYQQTQRLRRSLLYLLEKLVRQLQDLFDAHQTNWMGKAFYQRLKTIKTVIVQQKYLLNKPSSSLPKRIVSLAKPYVRPIVRGKETKPFEFGAKAHITLTAGLAWIEHLSFEAFHEGIRLKKAVVKHEHAFGLCKMLGADNIYPTNENRRFITQRKIQTCFAKKGPKPLSSQEKQVKTIIYKARASQMEGIFGNQKNHYLLNKIKARSQPAEETWIFFGILTANAVKLTKQAA
jgi:transposase, IS5 family